MRHGERPIVPAGVLAAFIVGSLSGGFRPKVDGSVVETEHILQPYALSVPQHRGGIDPHRRQGHQEDAHQQQEEGHGDVQGENRVVKQPVGYR